MNTSSLRSTRTLVRMIRRCIAVITRNSISGTYDCQIVSKHRTARVLRSKARHGK